MSEKELAWISLYFLLFTILFTIWGLICRAVVKSKGYDDRDNHGFAWGFWLNIIGLIVCAAKPSVLDSNSYSNRISTNHGEGLKYQPVSNSTEWKCNKCGKVNDSRAYECISCGNRRAKTNNYISTDSWVCICGARNSFMQIKCNKCGRSKEDYTSNKPKTVTIDPPAPKPKQAVSTPVKLESSFDQTKKDITELKSMFDEGLITEEEFTAKKKQILGI